jgi:hypothetical protein
MQKAKSKAQRKKLSALCFGLLANNITNEKIYYAGYRYFTVMCFPF